MRLRLRFAITDENCSYMFSSYTYTMKLYKAMLLYKKLHATYKTDWQKKREVVASLHCATRLKWVLRGNIFVGPEASFTPWV